jgi:Icc protein
MERETTFVHLTDLHIGRPGYEDPHLFSDTTATLETILEMVATISPKPSFIVASGDLTNRGDIESFGELKRIMGALDIPVIYALGNHDTREGFYEGFLEQGEHSSAPYFHDRVIDGVHVIALDSSIPGQIGGNIEPEQFDWLEQVIETHSDLPKLVVSHHAPAIGNESEFAPWRSIRVEDTQRLAEILKGRNVVGLLSGHVHYDRVSVWHGIPVVIGMGQHAATDILQKDVLRMVNGASFAIGTIRDSGLTVSFVPLPSDRAELNRYPLDFLRKLNEGETLAAE